MPFRELRTQTWQDVVGEEDTLTAPWGRSVRVTDPTGVMQGGLHLTEIRTGDEGLRDLDVAGVFENGSIETPSSIGSIVVGAIRLTEIKVGLFDTFATANGRLADTADDFETFAYIGEFRVTGEPVGVDRVGRELPSFINSLVQAWEIQRVQLEQIESANDGDPFGFVTHQIERYQRDRFNFDPRRSSVQDEGVVEEVEDFGTYLV